MDEIATTKKNTEKHADKVATAATCM